MANSFTNNKKVKLIARAVADQMDYITASKSYMPQSEFKGKKFGKTYSIYIPDAGKVVNGLTADPDDVNEIECPVTLDNFNNSVEITAWNSLGDIDSFIDEIATPRGTALARTVQKKVVEGNVFKSAQAVVATSAGFGVLSEASADLQALSPAGDIVSFQHPVVMGKIAASGLANFIPAQQAKDIYTKNYLGEYAGASQIGLAVLPTVTTGSTLYSGTISLSAVSGKGFAAVDSITLTNGIAGAAFKAEGLKVVDASGVETDQDYIIIADAEGNIPQLRITLEGQGYNNPNAWVASGTSSLTLTPILAASSTYYVGQVRTKDGLAYDDYKFEDLPGSENEAVATEGAVTVKMSQYGDGKNLTKLVRLDMPFAAATPDARASVTVYIKK